jgi:hypothetical protein
MVNSDIWKVKIFLISNNDSEAYQIADKLRTLLPQHFDASKDVNHVFTADSFSLDSQC